MTSDFWVCIPARRASSRLPDKVLQTIGDAPMIVHVVRVALRSQATQVILAFDDEAIANCVRQASDQTQLGRLRLVKTREDHASGTDRLVEVTSTLQAQDDQILVNLQGDEPLMPHHLLNEMAEQLCQNPQASVATAACPMSDPSEWASPAAVKVVTDNQSKALYFSRASIPVDRDTSAPEAPPMGALRHLGLYAYRAGALKDYGQWAQGRLEKLERLEQLRWLEHGHQIVVKTIAQAPPAGVDTAEDLDRVRACWASGL